ncbi:hypothetical protein [Haloarchaeobius litoreus]|uniref:Dolichyl-phosphate-mannose-protein mannosyltransferase n=1 Tax=Haloarchaeobius litoreus TaxID=755306 RepID=A0ABD6DP11_9EURY|nr:hypothetical protein [Haloarchaeobius litoreus]
MTSHRTVRTALLAIGYLALALGAAVAHGSPARGYELSIYGATPAALWLGIATALLTAAVAGLTPGVSRSRRLAATGLVGLSGVTIAGLPLLRNYYFYGSGDSLSHLGWARELAGGSLSPTQLLYPGVHELTVVLGSVTGATLRLTMLWAVLVFATLFLLFVALSVRLLSGRREGLLVGAFLGLLFVPINVIAMHMLPHTSSQAVLYAPFVLFLLFVFLEQDGWRPVRNPPTAVGVLLGLASLSAILVHPQQAANLLVVFATVAGIQLVARVLFPESRAARQRPVYVQTAIFALAFLVWAPRFQRVGGNTSAIAYNIVYGSGGGSEVVTQKSTSLTAVGGSVPELFVKLFLTDVVLSILAASVLVLAFLGRLTEAETARSQFVRYLGLALVPLSGLFLMMFVGGPGDMYFRYQGLLMVPVTILGGVGLVRWLGDDGAGGRFPIPARVLMVCLLLAMVPLGVPALFGSPYVYQSNSQVVELEYEGYEHAFDVRAEGIEFTGIRGGPERYVDAVYGTEQARNRLEFPGYEDAVAGPTFERGLGYEFNRDRYFTVGGGAYEREVGLFDGLRYNATGFQKLGTDPGVNRVSSNGGLELYYLYGDGEDDGESGTASLDCPGPDARTDRPRAEGAPDAGGCA